MIASQGSVCGSVGRAGAYDTRDMRFEYRHQQNFIYQLYNRKDENIKEASYGPSKKDERKTPELISFNVRNLANGDPFSTIMANT